MNHRRLVSALAFASLMLGAADAAAWEPTATQQRGGGDVYWWSAKGAGSSFALVPFLQLRMTDTVFLDVRVPVGMNINGFDDKSRLGLGNPMVGAHYAIASSTFTWYVGGRANVPLTSLFDDANQQFATATAGISMALYDAHLWEVQYIPVAVFGGVEIPASEAVMVRAELAPQLDIPLAKARPDGKLQFDYQIRGEVEARAPSGIGGGGALQLFHAPGRDGDNAQASVEGFFGYTQDTLFLRAGLLVALDEPLGFGFDKGKVVSLHLAIGTRF